MIGLVRPLVILPEDLPGTLRGPELADILVHECAHAVCRHQVVGVLQRLAGMLFWPHPLMHMLNRELARAREEVCDNYVLRHGQRPVTRGPCWSCPSRFRACLQIQQHSVCSIAIGGWKTELLIF